MDLAEKFDSSKIVYAYVISEGVASNPVPLKIEFAEPLPQSIVNVLRNYTYSLVGSDGGLSISIPESVPLVGGSNIDLKGFSLPIGVEVTGSRVKMSIGIDIFSKETELISGKKKNDNDKDKENPWFNYKKDVKTLSDHLKGSDDAWKDYTQLLDNKKIRERTKTKSGFNVGVLGYIEFDYSSGFATPIDSFISINGEFSLSATQQFATLAVPLYVSARARAKLSLEAQEVKIVNDSNLPFQYNLSLIFNPNIDISGGVGVKDVVSLGVYGNGNLNYNHNFLTNHIYSSVDGELGLRGEVYLMDFELPLLEDKYIICDYYYGNTSRMLRSYARACVEGIANGEGADETTVVSRDYAEETSEWLGEYPVSLLNLAENGVTFKTLQANVFEQSKAEIAAFGEKLIMTWIEDDASRDSYNRMRLVYSIYDLSADTWSEPKPVYDDGNNDAYPMLVSDGKEVYVAWQKINKKLSESEMTSLDAFIKNSEIYVSKYDTVNDCFINTTRLTDNDVYDYLPTLTFKNNDLIVYYAQSTDNNLLGNSNIIYRQTLGGTAEALRENENYIIDLTVSADNISFATDADGDTSTSTDINVFTLSDNIKTGFDKGENNVAYTTAIYGEIDGKTTLFVSDSSNIYYVEDNETKTVFDEVRSIEGNINVVTTDSESSILWTETNDEGGNEVYSVSYRNGGWTDPIIISELGSNLLTNMDVAVLGNRLFGVCNLSEMVIDENSGNYIKASTNLNSFTANEFTDVAVDIYFIDENSFELFKSSEIEVYVTNEGTTDIKNIEFVVSDTLGTRNTVTKEVDIKSGETEVVNVEYKAPLIYGSTSLEISATVPGSEEADLSDNKTSLKIGNSDLRVKEVELLEFGDNYLLKSIIENNSRVSARDIIASVKFNDASAELYDYIEIGNLSKSQYANFEFVLSKDLIEFNENGLGKVYINVTSSSNEIADGDNEICVPVTLPQETTCAHPLMAVVASKSPTCTTDGAEEGVKCAACEEIIEPGEVIPATGHDWGDWQIVTSATCESEG